MLQLSSVSFCHADAAPEWQASSLGWRSREPLVACLLEGLVRSGASQMSRSQTFRFTGNAHSAIHPLQHMH
jgi:hypothetical protein